MHTHKQIAVKGLYKWGVVKQILMVAEESIELSHAVLKWKRAYDAYVDDDSDISKLAELEERENNVILEASQLKLVMEIPPLVINDKPTKWLDVNNDVLHKASIKVGLTENE